MLRLRGVCASPDATPLSMTGLYLPMRSLHSAAQKRSLGGGLDCGSERLGMGLFVVGGDGNHHADFCPVGIGIDFH